MGYQDVAQVCLNGHVINSNFINSPEFNQEFCDKCGEKTITQCSECNQPIKGDYYEAGVFNEGFTYKAPSYCHHCGKPFPWLQASFDSAKEILDFDDDIADDDKEKLMQSIIEITKDSPKTEFNALIIKNIAKKLGSDTYKNFYKIAMEVGTELAKKILIGG